MLNAPTDTKCKLPHIERAGRRRAAAAATAAGKAKNEVGGTNSTNGSSGDEDEEEDEAASDVDSDFLDDDIDFVRSYGDEEDSDGALHEDFIKF